MCGVAGQRAGGLIQERWQGKERGEEKRKHNEEERTRPGGNHAGKVARLVGDVLVVRLEVLAGEALLVPAAGGGGGARCGCQAFRRVVTLARGAAGLKPEATKKRRGGTKG